MGSATCQGRRTRGKMYKGWNIVRFAGLVFRRGLDPLHQLQPRAHVHIGGIAVAQLPQEVRHAGLGRAMSGLLEEGHELGAGHRVPVRRQECELPVEKNELCIPPHSCK